jgi:dTMP kinase
MLITFEGIEGSGKSTQIRHAAAYLTASGHCCQVTQQPGGTRIGRQIRAVLLDPANREMDPVAELLLYAADRRQHIREVIRPALDEGKIVICDRFHDSTAAYQGFSRGLDMALIREVNQWVLTDLEPDLTFLLDLSPEIGLGRAWREVDAGEREMGETRFEAEAIEFHRRVRAGYLELARREPARFVVIDAAREEEMVRRAICSELAERLQAAG